jgi:CBS domain-containing protein
MMESAFPPESSTDDDHESQRAASARPWLFLAVRWSDNACRAHRFDRIGQSGNATPAYGGIMSNVAQILHAKADHAVHTVSPGASVFEALAIMAEKNIGALPVVELGKVVGIIGERNYARRIAVVGRSSRDTPVAEIMETRVWYVEPHNSREQCMALMTEKRARHLVVIEDGRLTGLISIGDVVKDTITEQQFIIEQLEHYIAGVRG